MITIKQIKNVMLRMRDKSIQVLAFLEGVVMAAANGMCFVNNGFRLLLSAVAVCLVYSVIVPVALAWDPLTDAGANLIGWYDASDGDTVLTSGRNATNWLDKSANGYDLDTPYNNRVYFDNVPRINGLTAVEFTYIGYIQRTGMPDIDLTDGVCLISVGQAYGGDTHYYGSTSSTNGSSSIYFVETGSGTMNASVKVNGQGNNFSFVNTPSYKDGVPFMCAVYYDPAGMAYLRGNGGADTASSARDAGATFTINAIKAGRLNNTASHYHGEMIFLNTADIGTIEKVEGYLAHKWGLLSALPEDHPYRYSEPDAPIPFGALSSSNITATSADLYVEAETNLTSATVVWDTSDKGTANVTDWTGTNSVSVSGLTPGTISGLATGLTADTDYVFRFYGEDGVTNGWSTLNSFATTLTAAAEPSFTSASGAYNGVSLQWDDNANSETGYILQRSTNGTSFSLLTVLPADTTSYTDGAVLVDRTYYYRLAATNSVNESGTDPSACQTNAFTALAANMIFYEGFEDPVIDGVVDTVPPNWVMEPAPAGGDAVRDLPSLADGAVTGKTGDQYLSLPRYNYGITTKTDVGLTNALQPYVNYTLTCDLSASTDQNFMYVELRAGTNVLMVKTNVAAAITTGDLSANPISMSFLAFPDHPYIGETLSIRLYVTYNAYHAGRWYFDNLALYATDTSSDTAAPTPTNMEWIGLPTSSVSNSIAMQAATAVDDNGVQYFFTNTVNGNVSGWQESPIWSDTGLTPGVTYSYKVKARDKSSNTNETNWSAEESAECEPHIILYESFEVPSILLRPATVLSFNAWPLPPDGWGYYKKNSLDVWHDTAAAVSTPFGEQYVAMRALNSITATSLGHVLEVGYTYRATCNAGGMNNSASGDRPVTSQVELWAGSTLVASNTFSVTTSDLSETSSFEFVPDTAHTNLGDALTLKLWVVSTPSGWNDRGQFDNIKLYAIPPLPSGTLLLLR